MVLRVLGSMASITLIALFWDTLLVVVKYYTIPGSFDLEAKFLRFKNAKSFEIFVLTLCVSMLILLVLPPTMAVYKEELANNQSFLKTAIVAPVLEEAVFRIAPWGLIYFLRKLLKRNKFSEYINVVVAVISSVIFGLLHLTNFVNLDIWTYLHTLGNMSFGLFMWYIIEKDGILTSAVFHILHNSLVYLGP